jgi:hypothetical protein
MESDSNLNNYIRSFNGWSRVSIVHGFPAERILKGRMLGGRKHVITRPEGPTLSDEEGWRAALSR